MGGLLILLMTVGRWMDIVSVLISLAGETWCLIWTGSELEVCRQQVRRRAAAKVPGRLSCACCRPSGSHL